jgi:ADP-ribose pyrophosphatase YjhB (NUDIX family)
VRWGESLEEALVREVAEETGLQCELGRVLAVNDTIAPDDSRHLVNITFECEVLGGAITDSPDDERVEAVELIDPDDLLDLDMRPPIAPRLLSALETECATHIYLGTVFAPETGDQEGAS